MDRAQNRKNLMLLSIIAIIVVYIAVSVYGIIRDLGTGQAVFIITSDLPRIAEPRVPFLDRVRSYFNPPEEVLVPVEQKVTIRGLVVYTNRTPYANGLVELRSEPRITRTDDKGNFIFEDVEDGEHTINVLNQSRQVLATCSVSINRNDQIKDAVLVQVGDKSFVLEVAVDVKVLEIVLEIEQGGGGEPTGKLIVNPRVVVLEYIDGKPPPDQPIDHQEPVITSPPIIDPGGNTGGGGGRTGVVPRPSAGDLTVYSSDVGKTRFNKPPESAAAINIFGAGKHIAPGMSGAYKFTVDNTGNRFAIYYDISLIESDNHLNIPMKYRLYDHAAHAYVNRDEKWHTIAQIMAATANKSNPLSMAEAVKTEYTLEWLWDDSVDDGNHFAAHGGEIACTLTIEVSAQRK